MRLALIGCGKMGKTVERIGLEMGHEILIRIDSDADWDTFGSHLGKADVAIEFTTPGTVVNNVKRCFDAGIPVVTGTTNWDAMKPDLKNACKESGSAIVSSSNFSVGVNLFFRINKYAAHLLKSFPNYDVKIEEVHHLQKLDAPSGTAKVIANDILGIYKHKTDWVNTTTSDRNFLGIESKREGDVKGDHMVTFFSDIDQIQLKHSAGNRDGFARGALLAAGWIIGKKGWFTMDDVLGTLSGFDNQV